MPNTKFCFNPGIVGTQKPYISNDAGRKIDLEGVVVVDNKINFDFDGAAQIITAINKMVKHQAAVDSADAELFALVTTTRGKGKGKAKTPTKTRTRTPKVVDPIPSTSSQTEATPEVEEVVATVVEEASETVVANEEPTWIESAVEVPIPQAEDTDDIDW